MSWDHQESDFLNWSLIVATKALLKEAQECDTAPPNHMKSPGREEATYESEIRPTAATKWTGAFS